MLPTDFRAMFREGTSKPGYDRVVSTCWNMAHDADFFVSHFMGTPSCYRTVNTGIGPPSTTPNLDYHALNTMYGCVPISPRLREDGGFHSRVFPGPRVNSASTKRLCFALYSCCAVRLHEIDCHGTVCFTVLLHYTSNVFSQCLQREKAPLARES